MNHTLAAAVCFSLFAGLVVGTIYGRKVTQKVVGTALADYARVDSAAAAVVNKLHGRLAFLSKYVPKF